MFRFQVFKSVAYNGPGDQPKQATTTAIEFVIQRTVGMTMAPGLPGETGRIG
jgi:hypothetical protein